MAKGIRLWISGKFIFDPHDMWVGLYWRKSGGLVHRDGGYWHGIECFICIVPMLPFKLSILVPMRRK